MLLYGRQEIGRRQARQKPRRHGTDSFVDINPTFQLVQGMRIRMTVELSTQENNNHMGGLWVC
jgi:hypothetical protein